MIDDFLGLVRRRQHDDFLRVLRTAQRRGLDDTISKDDLEIPPPHTRTKWPPPPAPRAPGAANGALGNAEAWIAQIGGASGFRESMKTAIAAYIGDWGHDANLEPLRAAIEKRFAEADAGERSEQTLNRYLADIDDIAATIRELQRQSGKPGRLIAPGFKLVDAPFALPTAAAPEIREATGRAITSFFAKRFDTQPPPRVLLKAVTGAAKTELLLERIVAQVPFDRDSARRPWRVIVSIPAHRLGRKLAARINKVIEGRGLKGKVRVAVYEGRGDPFNPPAAGRQYPCGNLEEVGLALNASADVRRAVCGSKATGPHKCRLRDSCGYYAQLAECGAADIVILAHNYIFDGLRAYQQAPLLHDLNVIVLEEDVADTITLGSVALPISTFDSEQLDRFPVLIRGVRSDQKTRELDAIFAKIQNVLDLIDAGNPCREAIATAGLTKSEADQARALNWQRRVDDMMFPGMPLDERKMRAAQARHNSRLGQIAAALHAFAEVAEAAAKNKDDDPNDAVGERLWIESGRLQVPGFRRPADWVSGFPVIWASATTRIDRARQLFPDIQVVEPPPPATPHQRIHLRLGAFGKGAFGRSAHKITDMVDRVRVAMLGKKSGLVVCHKDVEHAFTDITNVKTLHHGSVAGDDDFHGIDSLFVVGGPFAPPGETRKLAQAEARCRILYGKPVRTPCSVTLDHPFLEHATGVQIERLAYADPRMQRVHEGVYDAGIIQAVGRARGLNRGENNPVDIFVYANLPLPLPVTTIERTKPVSRLDKMFLAEHVPTNARDMARAHPRMFPSAAAAAQARQRWHKLDGMQRRIVQLAQLAGDAWDEVLWQPDAKGHKARISFVPHAKRGEFKAEVIRNFGGYLIWQERPLYRPDGWVEDMDIPGKRDFFLGMSDSSWDGQPRMRVSRAARAARPAQRAPPDQIALF
jgi:putative DNA primase/helicase